MQTTMLTSHHAELQLKNLLLSLEPCIFSGCRNNSLIDAYNGYALWGWIWLLSPHGRKAAALTPGWSQVSLTCSWATTIFAWERANLLSSTSLWSSSQRGSDRCSTDSTGCFPCSQTAARESGVGTGSGVLFLSVMAFTVPFTEEVEGEQPNEMSCWVNAAGKTAALFSILAECRYTEELSLFICLRSSALYASVLYAVSHRIIIKKEHLEIWTKNAPYLNTKLIFWSFWWEKTPLYVPLNLACAYFVMSYKIFIFVVWKFTVNLVHSEVFCTLFPPYTNGSECYVSVLLQWRLPTKKRNSALVILQ